MAALIELSLVELGFIFRALRIPGSALRVGRYGITASMVAGWAELSVFVGLTWRLVPWLGEEMPFANNTFLASVSVQGFSASLSAWRLSPLLPVYGPGESGLSHSLDPEQGAEPYATYTRIYDDVLEIVNGHAFQYYILPSLFGTLFLASGLLYSHYRKEHNKWLLAVSFAMLIGITAGMVVAASSLRDSLRASGYSKATVDLATSFLVLKFLTALLIAALWAVVGGRLKLEMNRVLKEVVLGFYAAAVILVFWALKELGMEAGFKLFADLILFLVGGVAAKLITEMRFVEKQVYQSVMGGEEAARRMVEGAEVTEVDHMRKFLYLATLFVALASIFASAHALLSVAPEVERASAVPEATSLPEAVAVELVSRGNEYYARAPISFSARDAIASEGGRRKIAGFLAALAYNATASGSERTSYALAPQLGWHIMLVDLKPIGYFDVTASDDRNEAEDVLEVSKEATLREEEPDGSLKTLPMGDENTPSTWKWYEKCGLFLVLAVRDGDGNEAAWVVPVSLEDPDGASLGAAYEAVISSGSVTVVVPDSGEERVVVAVDGPSRMASGYRPTVILRGPVRFGVGGREYGSNCTVALWISPTAYRLSVVWPERHDVWVAPEAPFYAALVAAAAAVPVAVVLGWSSLRRVRHLGPKEREGEGPE